MREFKFIRKTAENIFFVAHRQQKMGDFHAEAAQHKYHNILGPSLSILSFSNFVR